MTFDKTQLFMYVAIVPATIYLNEQRRADGFYRSDIFDIYTQDNNVFLRVDTSKGTFWRREINVFYDLNVDAVFDKNAHYMVDIQTSNASPLIVLANSNQPNLSLYRLTDRKNMKDFEIAEADSILRASLQRGIMAIREYLRLPVKQ